MYDIHVWASIRHTFQFETNDEERQIDKLNIWHHMFINELFICVTYECCICVLLPYALFIPHNTVRVDYF